MAREGGSTGKRVAHAELERRADTLRVVSLVVAAALVVIAVLNVLEDPEPTARVVLGLVLLTVIGVSRLLLRRGRVALATHLFTLAVGVVVGSSVFVSGGLQSPSSATLVSVILIAGLVLGTRWVLVYTAACIATLLAAYFVQIRGLLPPSSMAYGPFATWSTESSMMLFVAIVLVVGLQRLERAHGQRLRQQERGRKLEEKLQQTQRLESVGLLAGGVAHDFNNLLTVILGSLERAAGHLPEDSPAREMLAEGKRAAERGATLTQQLLAFSGRQALKPRPITLNELVADSTQMLRRMIGEDITIRTDLDPDIATIHADPAQMEQVIMNLAVNARDAMPEGGTLTLRTRMADAAPDDADLIGLPSEGAHVLLEVADTGTGMDPAVKKHLFDPFFTTKPPGKGTGLGLSTILGIVRQSGGSIAVDSELGEGARFRLYFPASTEQAEDGRPETTPSTKSVGGTETILVVEDQEMVRRLIVKVLSASGYRVIEARNGSEALQLAEAHDGPIDLLLTDVVMPGINGRELVRRFADLRPRTPTLFMSGYADDVLDGSVLEILPKPFTPEQLVTHVRTRLDERADG